VEEWKGGGMACQALGKRRVLDDRGLPLSILVRVPSIWNRAGRVDHLLVLKGADHRRIVVVNECLKVSLSGWGGMAPGGSTVAGRALQVSRYHAAKFESSKPTMVESSCVPAGACGSGSSPPPPPPPPP
jgi:hypothetical protein